MLLYNLLHNIYTDKEINQFKSHCTFEKLFDTISTLVSTQITHHAQIKAFTMIIMTESFIESVSTQKVLMALTHDPKKKKEKIKMVQEKRQR